MSKKVIVTGCTGQTGSYMVDFLLANTDHRVYGVVRRGQRHPLDNLMGAVNHPRFSFVHADMTSERTVEWVVANVQPDYFINFAAQSSPSESFEKVDETIAVNSYGVAYALFAIHEHAKHCRFFNAGSSAELKSEESQTPYGASKILARTLVEAAREGGMFAVQGTLFNHESERRSANFVTRKITSSVARIRHEVINDLPIQPLEIGNINGLRGWMHAEDVVRGIWAMLNQDKPIEYELSSPKLFSIRQFISECFVEAGFGARWEGQDFEEKLLLKNLIINANTWWCANRETIPGVIINPKFWQPTDDIVKPTNFEAETALNWTRQVEFDELVQRMVQNDIKLLDEQNK